MLRATKDAPPNINDFMLYELILSLKQIGLKHLNLGLSPLVGLDEQTEQNSLISSVLGFAYVNGDRFYSFSGLHRFKDKYEPVWSDRYIAYKNGIRGFTKTLNGLLAAMKIRD
jgi:phosphatidylglycerol lysyltransferase